MNQRPLSVTVISCLFIATGLIGFVYHATEFRAQGPFQYDLVWVSIIRLLAVLGGVFMLRGSNWARWLLVGWMAYHVILSAFHTLPELATHGLLFAIISYVAFRPQTSVYFRSERGAGTNAKDR